MGVGRGAAVKWVTMDMEWWAWPGRCRGRWRRRYPDRMGSVARGHVGILLRRGEVKARSTIAMDSFLGEVRERVGPESGPRKEKPQGQQRSREYGQMGAGASLEAECRQRWDFMLSASVTPRTFENSDSPWLELRSPRKL